MNKVLFLLNVLLVAESFGSRIRQITDVIEWNERTDELLNSLIDRANKEFEANQQADTRIQAGVRAELLEESTRDFLARQQILPNLALNTDESDRGKATERTGLRDLNHQERVDLRRYFTEYPTSEKMFSEFFTKAVLRRILSRKLLNPSELKKRYSYEKILFSIWEKTNDYGDADLPQYTGLVYRSQMINLKFHSSVSEKSKKNLIRFSRKSEKVVLLQHGFLDSSDSWMMKADSLGYYLVERGFSVYIGNSRGNKYSMQYAVCNCQTGDFLDPSTESVNFDIFQLPESKIADQCERMRNLKKEKESEFFLEGKIEVDQLYKWNLADKNTQKTYFWDFSWDEMAFDDQPAFFEKIFEMQKKDLNLETQLNYVGHSQGTTQMFAALSAGWINPNHLRKFVALAPVVFVHTTPSSMVRIIAQVFAGAHLGNLTHVFASRYVTGFHFNPPSAKNTDELLGDDSVSAMIPVTGFSLQTKDYDMLTYQAKHFPSGTSTNDLLHWIESIRYKEFVPRQFIGPPHTMRSIFKFYSLGAPSRAIQTAFSAVLVLLKNVWAGIASIGRSLLNYLQSFLWEVAEDVEDGIESVEDYFSGLLYKVWEIIRGALRRLRFTEENVQNLEYFFKSLSDILPSTLELLAVAIEGSNEVEEDVRIPLSPEESRQLETMINKVVEGAEKIKNFILNFLGTVKKSFLDFYDKSPQASLVYNQRKQRYFKIDGAVRSRWKFLVPVKNSGGKRLKYSLARLRNAEEEIPREVPDKMVNERNEVLRELKELEKQGLTPVGVVNKIYLFFGAYDGLSTVEGTKAVIFRAGITNSVFYSYYDHSAFVSGFEVQEEINPNVVAAFTSETSWTGTNFNFAKRIGPPTEELVVRRVVSISGFGDETVHGAMYKESPQGFFRVGNNLIQKNPLSPEVDLEADLTAFLN